MDDAKLYEFTNPAGFDYNYDPLATKPKLGFDPYADEIPPSGDIHEPPTSHLTRETNIPALIPTRTTPTPEYLSTSQSSSMTLTKPSDLRKLLILDLNGTLLFRSPHVPRSYRHRYRRNQGPFPVFDDPDPYANSTLPRPLRPVHARPYISTFREYLFHPKTRKWLDTMVWSSAQPHSVSDMVDKCFGERKEELAAVWARDTLGLEERDYHRKTQTTKDLAKPWAHFSQLTGPRATSSATRQCHSARTTLLLDDSPLKAHLQPWNHLCIREYVAEMRRSDVELWEREQKIEQAEKEARDWEEADAENNELETIEGANGEPPGRGKKRKRAKKKKATPDLLESTDTAQRYDPTLLAVIGILDAIKYESNVAGWMQKGGIWNAIVDVPEGEDGRKSVGKSGRQRKTRIIDPGKVLEDGAEESEASLPPSSDDVVDDQGAVIVGDRPQESDKVAAHMWFDDRQTLGHWVRRGENALRKLGIEIFSGVSG